jgi:glycosyltransferase involved in cell wall biosynthesis
MSAPVAFYAPMKPPDHPVASGDRRMARSLMAALARAGFDAELVARLRSYDRTGDPGRQHRLATLGAYKAERLLRRYAGAPATRPVAWLTYHVYHKSPDWLGPVVAPVRGIPYLIAEASFAPRQAAGPWAFGHRAAAHAIRTADVVLAMTAVDAEGLEPLIAPPAELRRLPPFLDPAPFEAARADRAGHRARLAARFGLDPALPWLLAVAMMREDAKLLSYRLLAHALRELEGGWQLVIAGDGPARAEVEAAFAPLGPRVQLTGRLEENELPGLYGGCDLYVWPAVREAYGLAMLEAQASGLPVVAGEEGGVAEVLQDGVTGVLIPRRDHRLFAAAVAQLLDAPARRAHMADAAAAFVARERSLDRAGSILSDAIHAAHAINASRRWRSSG